MPYLDISTGQVVAGDNSGDLVAAFPNTSFPSRDLTTGELTSLGVIRVASKPKDTISNTHRLDVVVSDSGVVATWVQEDLPSDQVAVNRAAKNKFLIETTKSEAERRILAILPEWKQRNYTARAVEKVAAGEVGDDEWNMMQASWDQIKAVRVASDAIEAEIAALTHEQAEQYDVAASPFWP